MGQRHQIFLIIPNPCTKDVKHNEEYTRMKKLFGTKPHSILAFHNQWLYGRTALESALNVLTHASQFTKEQKIGDAGNCYNTPFTKKGQENHFGMHAGSVDSFIQKIECIINYMPVSKSYREAGFLGAFCINETDEMFADVDFAGGDNNDGITIIDTIENKYCFMRINEYDHTDELCYDADDLPSFVPVSAHDYVKTYYGETPETVNPYYYEKRGRKDGAPHTEVEKRKAVRVAKQNTKENAKLVKRFAKFELLTVKELKEYFPNNTVKSLK